MSINVNTLAVPPTVTAQIVTSSNGNLQQAFTKLVVHDGVNLGYKSHVRGFAEAYVFGNAAATPVAVTNTIYQFTQGTYTLNPVSVNFDVKTNGLRYIGASTGVFYINNTANNNITVSDISFEAFALN